MTAALNLPTLVQRISIDDSSVAAAQKRTQGAFSTIGDQASRAGTKLSLGLTLPIVGVGTAAVIAAADVDKGLREVNSLFGLTGDAAEENFGKMREQLSNLSTDVGVAQDVISKGLYQAISAGVPPENVFAFMETATKASIAGVTDVETAVDGITTVVNAFGLEATDAEAVADSMFATVQGGKTTFGDLSSFMFQVGPAAAAAKVSFQEVNAAIATLTSSGTPTAVATTQLRAALVGLQRPSEDLNEVFQALGYQNAQAAIEAEGLGFALDAVTDAAKGDNGRLTELLGSVEAVGAANVIATTGAEKFADEMERQKNSTGAASLAYEEMEKSSSRSFERLKVTLSNLSIELGAALLPFVDKAASFLTRLVKVFGDLPPGVKKAVVAIGGIAAAIGPILFGAGKVITLFKTFGPLLVSALSGPILPIALAFAAAGLLIFRNWDKIQPLLEDLVEFAKTAWSRITEAFSSGEATGEGGPLGFFSAVGATAREVFDWIMNVGLPAVEGAIGDFIGGFSGDGGDDFFSRLGANARAVMDFIVGTVIPAVTGAISSVVGGFSGEGSGDDFFTRFGEAARTAWDFIVGTVIPGIQDAVGNLIAGFQGTGGEGAFASIGEGLRVAYEAALDFVGFIRDDVVPFFQDTVIPFFADEVGPRVSAAFGIIRDAVMNVVGFVQSEWPKVREIIETVLDEVMAVVDFVWRGIQLVWRTAGDDILRLVRDVFGTVQEVIGAAMEIVQGIIQTVTSIITGDWSGAWEGLKNVLSGIWDGIIAIVTGAIDIVRDVLGGVASIIWELLQKPFEVAKEAIGSAIDGIVDFVTGLPGRILGLLEALVSAGASIGGSIVHGIIEGLGGVIDSAVDIAGTVVDALIGAFKSAWNGLVDLLGGPLESALGALDTALGPAVNFDEASLVANLTDVLKLAHGGTYGSRQAIIVGEEGPEIQIPRFPGSIAPRRRLEDLLADRGDRQTAGAVWNVQVDATERASGDQIARDLAWGTAVLRGGLTP